MDVLGRSVLGRALPEGFAYAFRSLWQLSDTEKATNAKTTTDAVVTAYDADLIDKPTAMKELRQSSHVTGVYTSITDEAIEEAENEPPPLPEMELPDVDDPNNGPEAPPQSGKDKRTGKGVSDAASPGRAAGGRVGKWLSAWRSRRTADD